MKKANPIDVKWLFESTIRKLPKNNINPITSEANPAPALAQFTIIRSISYLKERVGFLRNVSIKPVTKTHRPIDIINNPVKYSCALLPLSGGPPELCDQSLIDGSCCRSLKIPKLKLSTKTNRPKKTMIIPPIINAFCIIHFITLYFLNEPKMNTGKNSTDVLLIEQNHKTTSLIGTSTVPYGNMNITYTMKPKECYFPYPNSFYYLEKHQRMWILWMKTI